MLLGVCFKCPVGACVPPAQPPLQTKRRSRAHRGRGVRVAPGTSDPVVPRDWVLPVVLVFVVPVPEATIHVQQRFDAWVRLWRPPVFRRGIPRRQRPVDSRRDDRLPIHQPGPDDRMFAWVRVFGTPREASVRHAWASGGFTGTERPIVNLQGAPVPSTKKGPDPKTRPVRGLATFRYYTTCSALT